MQYITKSELSALISQLNDLYVEEQQKYAVYVGIVATVEKKNKGSCVPICTAERKRIDKQIDKYTEQITGVYSRLPPATTDPSNDYMTSLMAYVFIHKALTSLYLMWSRECIALMF